MMALAIAAVAGVASASSCGEDCPFGYRLKVMVRTTASCKVVSKDACNECTTDNYRGPVIRRFMGMVYGVTSGTNSPCSEVVNQCDCNTWENNAYVAFYDYDNATPMVLNADMTELIQLNRIGCKAEDRNKAEMAFSIGFVCKETSDAYPAQMMFAGFGLCGNHNGQRTVGAISGYCAGRLPAGATVKELCSDVTSCGNLVWNLCCNTSYKCYYTAAYGKWTLVWDSTIADKVGSNLTLGSDAKAKTGWGTADAVLLADKRDCKDVPCGPCQE